jgi:hypothetical protein
VGGTRSGEGWIETLVLDLVNGLILYGALMAQRLDEDVADEIADMISPSFERQSYQRASLVFKRFVKSSAMSAGVYGFPRNTSAPDSIAAARSSGSTLALTIATRGRLASSMAPI